MEDWNMDKEELKKLCIEREKANKDENEDGRLFKIYHEKEDFERTLKEDLKVAAKNSTHRRNRSPDDGF